MKKFILLMLLILTTCCKGQAEEHYLKQIEIAASIYNLELLKADLQKVKDIEGRPFYIVKRNNSLDEAYDDLTYWLSMSLSTYNINIESDRQQILKDWRSCRNFMISYGLFDFDGFCDKNFADYLSREEYCEITDFLFFNLLRYGVLLVILSR